MRVLLIAAIAFYGFPALPGGMTAPSVAPAVPVVLPPQPYGPQLPTGGTVSPVNPGYVTGYMPPNMIRPINAVPYGYPYGGLYPSTPPGFYYCGPGALCRAPMPPPQTPNSMSQLLPVMIMMGALVGAVGGGDLFGKRFDVVSGDEGGPVGGSGYETDSGSIGSGSDSGEAPTASPSRLHGRAPIIDPFKQWFPQCTQKVGLGTCHFLNLGIWPSRAHLARNPHSCHNFGEAIDVGPLTCTNGGKIGTMDPRFYAMAHCMAYNTDNHFRVIYYKGDPPRLMQKSDHTNHMHIQMERCPYK